MTEFRIQTLPEDEAVHQIVETVQQSEAAVAPFALVVGSGFSHTLVPTARELVEVSLPLWKKSLNGNEIFEQLAKLPDDQRNPIAREFWKRFVDRNAKRNLELRLDPETGLPDDYSAAYRAAFNPNYIGAAGEPAQARKLQRTLMRLDQPRLNAAHFLLASLLGVQPGQSRRNDLFKARAAFCRLILTTNFDPFLQIALQAVNRLYFMSDTPELGVSDEILDDQTDAIHLVYLHGSIHRRSQAATDADIKALKEKNARVLAPVLKRHGVIVLGYSGWDDAIVEALAACDRFDHRLYWCGREADPLMKGSFGPRVADILRKPTALYVHIRSAGHFMAQLYGQLVQGLPRLLDNPIGQLREMLQTIDLMELQSISTPVSAGSTGPQPLPDTDAFVAAQKAAIERLLEAEQVFVSLSPQFRAVGESVGPDLPAQPPEVSGSDSESRAGYLLSSARVAAALGNHVDSLGLYTQALNLGSLPVTEQAEALLGRGLAFYFSEEIDQAQADWTRLLELSHAPVERVATALNNRGFTWGQKGDTEKALADYTRVIEQLPGAPVEQVAKALYNRGVSWGQKGDTEKALADHTRVIEQLPGAPVEQVAKALNNRGVTWGQKGDTEKELADYTRVIEQLPGAPVEQVAQALTGRGWLHYQRKAYADFLSDTEAALSKFPTLVSAAFNLGLALLACERDEDALVAYQRSADQFPGAIKTEVLPDLAEAQQTWLSENRAAPVIDLLRAIDLESRNGG